MISIYGYVGGDRFKRYGRLDQSIGIDTSPIHFS